MIIAIALIVLIAASAFFSASETALFSLQRTKVEMLGKETRRGRKLVAELLSKPSNLLSTILIGNMAVNVLASAMSARFATENFGPKGLPVSIVAMWLIILVFGEITPKTIAIKQNLPFAVAVAPALRVFSAICFPLRVTLNFISDNLLRLVGLPTSPSEKSFTPEEMKTAFKLGQREGELDEMEERILRRIMDFDTKSITASMTPRGEVISSNVLDGWPGISEIAKKHNLSRIPVYENDPENMIGIAYVKDLVVTQSKAPLRSVLRPPLFVPEQQKIGKLFFEMRRQKVGMAIVVDEYGTVEGLVTMHDLLEEIIGQVPKAGEEAAYQETADNHWLVKATMSLGHFQDVFGISFPEGEYETLGGYVLGILGELPQPGQSVDYENVVLTVQEREENRIVSLSVSFKECEEEIDDA